MKTKILTLILCIIMIFAITSCSAKPEFDLDNAKENLEDNDYTVNVYDENDEDDLAPGETEKLVASNSDEYICIIIYEDTDMAKLTYEKWKFTYDSEIKTLELQIKTIKHILDKYEGDLTSDEIDDYEDEIKELNKNLEKTKEDYVFGISGKIVWYGTADAIEDSKK